MEESSHRRRRARVATVALLTLPVAAGACGNRDEQPRHAPRAGAHVVLELDAAPLDEQGRLHVSFPLPEAVTLRLVLENEGGTPVQIPRSSYPSYSYFSLEVSRVEDDGTRTPVPAYFDIYPTKDMAPPEREYVTLAPGAEVVRDVRLLLREGYGLQTFAAASVGDHLGDLQSQGFGELRRLGRYEVVGVYRLPPRALGRDGEPLFEGETGRDESLNVYAGPTLRTPPLAVVVDG